MTKQDELKILAYAIAKLGVDSYLGGWLSQVSGEVESYIRSDYFPTCSLRQTAEDINRMKAEAKAVLDKAHKSAADIIAAGHKTAQANADAAGIDVNKAIDAAIRTLQDNKH